MRKINRQQDLSVRELYEERLAQLRDSIAKNRAQAIERDKGKDVTTLPQTPEQRRKHWEEMAKSRDYYRELIRKQIDDALLEAENGENNLTIKLGNEFLKAAEQGNARALEVYLEEGFPATWQDPETKETALHITAACQARKALRVLLKNGTCNFLLRDAKRRLPSEMAYLYGEDPAVARLLGNKERKQAEAQGINVIKSRKINEQI